MRLLLLVQGVILALIVALFMVMVAQIATDPEDMRTVLEGLKSALTPDDAFDLIVTIVLVVLIFGLWQQTRARLTVGEDGIHARMPIWLGLPGLRQTGGHWHLPWRDIRRVRLESPERLGAYGQGLRLYRLVFTTSSGEVRVNPYMWYDPDGPDHRANMSEMLGSAKDNLARINASPLVQLIKARGLEVEGATAAEQPQSKAFDLTRHKGMIFQLVVLFTIGGYFAIDYFFLAPYLPLEPVPKTAYLPVAACALLAITLTGRGAPSTERIAVGMLVLAAVLAAVYPATLRFNARDADTLTTTYEAVAVARFTAPEADLPEIDLSDHLATEYWEQYVAGTHHEFTLMRGRGDFYQLHMKPLERKIRSWYENRDSTE